MAKNKVALGIDIGGTNTIFGLVNEKGTIFAKSSLPTKGQENAENLFVRLFDLFHKDMKGTIDEVQIVGVGVGAPNGNFYKGTKEYKVNR